MKGRPRSRGFTLIEILVVLIVVGLLAALAVVNLAGSGQSREVENKVRELYLLMQTASEQAILNNEELGLLLTENGYRFVLFNDQDGEWTEQDERLFRPRALPEWLVVTPLIEDDLPRLASSEDKLRPDLVFFSSGEVTPFELEFTVGTDTARMHRITSDGISGLDWSAPGDEGRLLIRRQSPLNVIPAQARTRGFTLIEVLVALLVFALVATAATQVGSQYISSYERIRDKTMATWIADNRMNELRLADTFPGVSENSDDEDYGPYRWRILTAVKGTEEPTIRRVEVTVSRFTEERSDPIAIYTLSGFIGEPQ